LAVSNDGDILSGFIGSRNSGRLSEIRCWQVSTGKELLSIPNCSHATLSGDGHTIAAVHLTPGAWQPAYRLSLWSVMLRQEIVHHELISRLPFGTSIAPNGRIVASPETAVLDSSYGRLLDRLGIRWPGKNTDIESVALFNASTGRRLGNVPGVLADSCWSSDSSRLAAVGENDRTLRIWDIPPRKSLTWFAAGAALLAIPVASIARWRVRRMRAA
jgi:WD40 repeat protein